MNRRAVARALGCSEAAVRRLQARGELAGTLDAAGAFAFDPAQVEEVRVRRAAAPPRAARPAPGPRTPEQAARELVRELDRARGAAARLARQLEAAATRAALWQPRVGYLVN